MTVRTFSIRAGLAASTVTPGRTAPDVSLTTAEMDAWAYAAAGASTRQAIANRIPLEAGMSMLFSFARSGTRTGPPTTYLGGRILEPPKRGGQYTRSGVSRFGGAR